MPAMKIVEEEDNFIEFFFFYQINLWSSLGSFCHVNGL